jgi:hypothetical protein
MPTLTRLLARLLVLAGLAYGAIVALATFVEPRQADIVIEVPLSPRPAAP